MSEYQKKTNNPKMGRPKVEIDKETFEKLCGIQCTKEEIASFFNCSQDTIENWCRKTYKSTFSAIYAKSSAVGKMSLRRSQFRLAEKNANMAIWLGKQYLGQTEKTDMNLGLDIPTDGLFNALSEGLLRLKNKEES